MVIETSRLILRPFSLDDLDDFYEYAKVEGVGEMAGWSHHKNILESLEILKLFMDSEEYAIVYKENNKVIGSVGFKNTKELPLEYENKKVKEIGYVLSKDYWGKEIMVEAVKALSNYYFKILDYDFLVCCAFKKNKRSQRVIEKLGFSYLKDIDIKTRYGTIENSVLNIKKNIYKS